MFDCQPKQINPFLETLQKCTLNSGWEISGADIIIIPDYASVMRNLLTHMGQSPLKTLSAIYRLHIK
eukprot:14383372-Ditylum_brightwellii.AAC.1